MTDYTVDTTGIQEGDSIVCTGTNPVTFGIGPALVASIAINYPDQTAANLPDTPADGTKAVVRVGTYPNQHQEIIRYHADVDKWIGEDEYVLVTQGDTWAMSLDNRNYADRLGWSLVSSPVPYGKSFALLSGDHDLTNSAYDSGSSGGTVTVDDTTSPHSGIPFQASTAASPYLQQGDAYYSYTGLTGTTFTGVKYAAGTRQVAVDAEYVFQGYSGGWGFNNTPILFAGDLFGAGLKLQEKLVSLMNSAPGGRTSTPASEHKLSVAPYWYQYDPGDGDIAASVPLSGGLGTSAPLTSLAATGGAQANGERRFYMTENDWTDWPLTTPTKRFLVPRIAGKMAAGATWSGTCLDTKLTVRWVV